MMRTTFHTMTSFLGDTVIVAGLFVAGLVHLVLTPEHAHDSTILGFGFFAVAALQLVLGCLFLRLRRITSSLEPVALAVVVFSLSTYVISRTTGISFGHSHVDQPLLLELICKTAELLVAGVLVTRGLHRFATPAAAAVPGTRVVRSFHPLPWATLGVLVACVLVVVGSYLASAQAHEHAAEHHHAPALSAREFHKHADK